MITGMATKVPMEVVRLTTATSSSRRVIMFRKKPRTEMMSFASARKSLTCGFLSVALGHGSAPYIGRCINIKN